MSREENVAIFEDTRAICKSNPIIANAILFSITQGYMNTGTAKC